MREQALRRILLVKAVEEADADGTLLPPADRAAAAREAVRAAPSGPPEAWMDGRAQRLLERIVARHPFVASVMAMLEPSPALAAGLALAGLAFGAALPVLDGSQRINVLAFPLLGIVAWNFAVYAALAAARLRRKPQAATPLRTWLATAGTRLAARTIARSREFNAPLAGALRTFAGEWIAATRPLLLARAAFAFHLAAAAVGVGLVAGLYVRGIAFDYRAGWESTFLDAGQARALLAILYGPASMLTGIAVPDAPALEAMRWRPGNGGGMTAAPWIHLMAATAFLAVVLPRLLLAAAAAWAAARRARNTLAPPQLASWSRSAFADIDGAVPRARAIVMPYAAELSPAALARLIAWVPGAVAGPVGVEARDSVPHGEEERYLAQFAAQGGEAADVVVLPFGLASTPEAEHHGAVLSGVRDRIAAARRGARVIVVIDEAPYASRMAAHPERLAERREAWRGFVRAHGLEPVFVSLAA